MIEPRKAEDVLDDSLGSPERFNKVGIEGPKISVSRIPDLNPFRANARAKLAVYSLQYIKYRVMVICMYLLL